MLKGFYNLSSAMLTQTRNLDIIGNNMSNTSTSGYKTDRYVDTTFDEVMFSRITTKQRDAEELGTTTSYMTAIADVVTDHSQGVLEQTNLPLDFAIEGEGYFSVQTNDGVAYTRNGSFMLDNEGYLHLGGQGRVLGANGQPIYLGTDKINADSNGFITNEQGAVLGQLGVFTFANPAQDLQKGNGELFTANGQPQLANGSIIHHKMVEKSNSNLVQQMTDMMVCQRALQSASQVSKMYDTVMTKTVSEIGRV
ncbi:MAG TPA: flagellar hook-basal body protein [Candidatus Butyricicoccus avistercoris]|uniref:Flagellar hook-basal body protein n=1 Tax=Candidatus Butyricicoccus avistercoris TaxID=2838518 RepID=A0A9D1PG62_9FIRM|nr:flagellar hook-basal body protein [Candidatus Butyricicoccus avistercoris]